MGPRLCAALLLFTCFVPASGAQVLRWENLNTEQIQSLDRNRTAVIIPGGILEQHGPYLPSGTDTFFNERLAARVADAIAARKGWTALLLPTIPLGSGGAEVIGSLDRFPGSVTVRTETLRSVYMDLADRLGMQGFRHILIIHNHGAPFHHRALVEAGEYFHDTYQGEMVHLLTLLDVYFCCELDAQFLTPEQVKEGGFSVHASTSEHSSILFLRPELVPASIRQAASLTGQDFAGLVAMARKPGWPGYFGAPRHASAAQGAAEFEKSAVVASEMALKILDGLDYRKLKQYGDLMAADPAVAEVDRNSLANEQRLKQQQEAWLARRAQRPR